MSPSLSASDIAVLAERVTGPVLARDDPGLAAEVTGINLQLRHSPEVTVGVASENDVVEAVRFADAHDLPIRVQATGHGAHQVYADGMLITTRRLDALNVDVDAHTATIGAGLRWADVVAAAAPHGLAPITGSAPGVGVVGFLLGGGVGPLARSHGFGADWVRSVRLVTGTGELVTASADENPELFWAFRGGKAGLGVVTEVTVELAAIPELYAGSLLFDTAHVDDVLRVWARWAREVPDTVTSAVAVLRLPDMEMVPPPMRGRTVLSVRVAVPGPAETGEAVIAPLRAAAPALLDDVSVLPLDQIGRIHNDPDGPSPIQAWSSGYALTGLDDELVEVLVRHIGGDAESPFAIAEVRHIGGQQAPRTAVDSAAGGRDSAFVFGLNGLTPEPTLERFPAAAAPIVEALGPWLAPQTTANYVNESDPDVFARRAWAPDVAERLRTVRSRVNPRGLVH
ncbi:FAD/FMN-containing dehydrogenase [Paramicrobacterium humi]|uniref:FAD/FMN-containing dehydrogenase n=1 Tax=Paramicrobacterium humi TaxID=640635 RepID=A0A1H4JRI5_9MICO|nr:FAD-binding oxidoreductase [Microbacterium humi]SEB48863.1 FAD/FMN-containing dehydrogenase [Microbacterium humi]